MGNALYAEGRKRTETKVAWMSGWVMARLPGPLWPVVVCACTASGTGGTVWTLRERWRNICVFCIRIQQRGKHMHVRVLLRSLSHPSCHTRVWQITPGWLVLNQTPHFDEIFRVVWFRDGLHKSDRILCWTEHFVRHMLTVVGKATIYQGNNWGRISPCFALRRCWERVAWPLLLHCGGWPPARPHEGLEDWGPQRGRGRVGRGSPAHQDGCPGHQQIEPQASLHDTVWGPRPCNARWDYKIPDLWRMLIASSQVWCI